MPSSGIVFPSVPSSETTSCRMANCRTIIYLLQTKLRHTHPEKSESLIGQVDQTRDRIIYYTDLLSRSYCLDKRISM